MTSTSTSGYTFIFKDGKLKPGIYKIQNVVSETYVDVLEHTGELCCRPVTVLEGNELLWEIRPLGPGYSIRKHEPGRPEQYCMVLSGLKDGSGRGPVSITPYPAAWRLEMAREELYLGCEYVRFFWGTTNLTWDLADHGSEKDRTPVHFQEDRGFQPCRIWKLIPVNPNAGSRPSIPGTGIGKLVASLRGPTKHKSASVKAQD